MKRQYLAISLIGVNSICCQIILIREIIAVFSGNELTMGFVLASWFLWVAIGSTIGGRWKSKNNRSVQNRFLLCQTILPFILIIQIILIRQSRYIFGLPQMAVVGLGPIFWVSMLLLAPLCLILGLMFTLGYQWISRPQISPAGRVGWVYVLEAIGAGAGGGLFSFLLIRIMSHVQICLLLGIINVISAAVIFSMESPPDRAGIWLCSGLILFFIILFFACLFLPIDLFIYSFQWRDFELLACRDSIFGRIALTRMNGEYSFYEHGVLTGTIPDLWTAEWSTHMPLVQHPAPKTALLIGTGLGSLKEALKHPSLNRIDYVELDPTALTLAEQYCPSTYTEPLKHPKVHPIHGDARLHLRATEQVYDLIILGLPDPKTAQLNRMYTEEFFALAANHLSIEGVVAFSVTSSENYIGPQLAEFLRCIYKTVKGIFPQTLVAPGDTAYFLLSKNNQFMSLNPDLISERLYERGIKTAFFSEFYLPSQLSKERIALLKDILKDTQAVWTNKDLRPVCYFYDLILWGRYFSPITGKILEGAKKINSKMLLIFLCIAAFFFIMLTRFLGKKRSRRLIIGFIVLFGGFIEIILEFLLILCFQVFYGYAYLQLGILITGFMVGLTIGSALMTHMLDKLTKTYQWFLGIQISYCLYPLLLILIFKAVDISAWHATLVEALFLILTLLAGFMGGFQFPIATRLFISSTKKWEPQAGFLYAVDLIGSALGAVVASSYFIPLFGIQNTLGILSLVGGIGAGLLIVNL